MAHLWASSFQTLIEIERPALREPHKEGLKVPEPLDLVIKEIIEIGPGIFNKKGKQLENLQYVIFLKSPDGEVTEVLGKGATVAEREAYPRGHQSSWYKGALMFGCAVLAGLVVLTFAISRESKKLLR